MVLYGMISKQSSYRANTLDLCASSVREEEQDFFGSLMRATTL
jgi:hypothetical protein